MADVEINVTGDGHIEASINVDEVSLDCFRISIQGLSVLVTGEQLEDLYSAMHQWFVDDSEAK